MMMSGAIVDTGVLVALINRKDTHHLWAKEVWKQLRPPLLTCEPVITEACFLSYAIEAFTLGLAIEATASRPIGHPVSPSLMLVRWQR
jgi:predicted nucleic acid-binding protein